MKNFNYDYESDTASWQQNGQKVVFPKVEMNSMEDRNNKEKSSELANKYFNRGLSRAKFQEYELAIEDYSKAIELNPKDADVKNKLNHIKTKRMNKKFQKLVTSQKV